jgi:hypothetical protein
MRRSVLALAALGTAVMAASCESAPEEAAPIVTGGGAAAAAEAQRDCFSARAVTGFRILDSDTVLLNVGPSTSYEVDAGGAACTNLGFANQIALQADPGSGFLCVGDGPTTASIRTDQGDDCQISAIRRAPPPAPATTAAPAPAG